MTREEIRARNIICVGFGILWLFDGLIQFLPQQGPNTLAMLAMGGWGQPMFYLNFIDNVVNFFYYNGLSLAFSLTLGIVQAAIGALMLLGPERRWGRVGLYASIPAAVGIWVLGEWMGGIVGFWTGGITFVNGGPGAVMLYLLGAWILLPSGRIFGKDTFARLRNAVGGLWVLGALLQTVPSLWQAGALSGGFNEVQVLTRQGFWVQPIIWFGNWTATAGGDALWNAVFVAVMLVIGLALLLRRDGPALYALAGLWVLFVWWVGENFGAVLGLATTDPNSGPAWAVLLLPLFLAMLARRRRSQADPGHSELRTTA
jgi:uncharacterized protein (TIGR03382 family)